MLKVEMVLRDEQGNNVLGKDVSFDDIKCRKEGIIVRRGKKYGLYNPNTFQKILDCEWDKITIDILGYLPAKGKKKAFFTFDGMQILECKWDRIKCYPNGLLVFRNGKYGFFDYSSNCITKCKWKRIEPHTQAIFLYGFNGEKSVKNYEGIELE